MAKSPVAIIILDGFGQRAETVGNAVAQANKPNSLQSVFNFQFSNFKFLFSIDCSGHWVYF